MELNPNYATGHHWFAELLTWQGRFDEALRESEMARRLDPLSLVIATDRAAIFYYARQYDRAIEEFRAVQEMDSKFPRVHVVIYASWSLASLKMRWRTWRCGGAIRAIPATPGGSARRRLMCTGDRGKRTKRVPR